MKERKGTGKVSVSLERCERNSIDRSIWRLRSFPGRIDERARCGNNEAAGTRASCAGNQRVARHFLPIGWKLKKLLSKARTGGKVDQRARIDESFFTSVRFHGVPVRIRSSFFPRFSFRFVANRVSRLVFSGGKRRS